MAEDAAAEAPAACVPEERLVEWLIECTGLTASVARSLVTNANNNLDEALAEALTYSWPVLVCLSPTPGQRDQLRSLCARFSVRMVDVPHWNIRPLYAAWADGRDRVSDADNALVPGTHGVTRGEIAMFEQVLELAVRPALMLPPGATPEILAVLSFGEAFSTLADWLCERCGCSSYNDFRTAAWRRDKFAQQERLRRSGLTCIKSRIAESVDDAVRIATTEFTPDEFPIVVKPTAAAGSEFVELCHDVDDVRRVCTAAWDAPTQQILPVRAVVLQEFVVGQEYVVDAVSCDGVAVFTDLWLSSKFPAAVFAPDDPGTPADPPLPGGEKAAGDEGAGEGDGSGGESAHASAAAAARPPRRSARSILYDTQFFVPECGPRPHSPNSECHRAFRVAEYTGRCLTALGHRWGPSHCEVMLLARNNEPCLIELNPRLQGDTPRSGAYVGYDQATLTAYLVANRFNPSAWPPPGIGPFYDSRKRFDFYASSAGFDPPPEIVDRMATWHPVEPTRGVAFLWCRHHSLVSEAAKAALENPRLLPTFSKWTRCMFQTTPQKGMLWRCPPTMDLMNGPGAIIFDGPKEAILADIAVVRAVESSEIVVLLETVPPLLLPPPLRPLQTQRPREPGSRARADSRDGTPSAGDTDGGVSGTPPTTAATATRSPFSPWSGPASGSHLESPPSLGERSPSLPPTEGFGDRASVVVPAEFTSLLPQLRQRRLDDGRSLTLLSRKACTLVAAGVGLPPDRAPASAVAQEITETLGGNGATVRVSVFQIYSGPLSSFRAVPLPSRTASSSAAHNSFECPPPPLFIRREVTCVLARLGFHLPYWVFFQ